MKFGKLMRRQIQPGLSYLDYKLLKQHIKTCRQVACMSSGDQKTPAEIDAFPDKLRGQLDAVNACYQEQLHATLLRRDERDDDNGVSEEEAMQAVALRRYALLNYVAALKILKKFKKNVVDGCGGARVADIVRGCLEMLLDQPFLQPFRAASPARPGKESTSPGASPSVQLEIKLLLESLVVPPKYDPHSAPSFLKGPAVDVTPAHEGGAARKCVAAPPVTILGHRGACGYAPANSLASFQKAIGCGVDVIEVDARVCGTGEVVMAHDMTLHEDRSLLVDETSLESLRVGSGGNLATLEEGLDFLGQQDEPRPRVYIDLKGESIARPTGEIVMARCRCPNGKWRPEHFLVASFNWNDAVEMKQHLRAIAHSEEEAARVISGITWVALTASPPLNYDVTPIAQLGFNVICADQQQVCRNFLVECHRHNMKLMCYTVNHQALAHRFARMGIDGMCGDYPDLLRQWAVAAR